MFLGNHPTRTLMIAAGAWLLGGSLAPSATAGDWRVTLQNQGEALGVTPILSPLHVEVPRGDYVLMPVGKSDRAPAPARVFSDGGTTYLATVLRSVPAHSTLTLQLKADIKSELSARGVEIRPADAKNLEILVDGKPLTTYRTDEPTKPFFFPVIGPTGDPITRAYPMKDVEGETRDHPHQRSFWFTHGNVNGIDFWASDPVNKPNPRFGAIVETSRKTVSSGAAVGVLRTTDDWVGPDGKTLCQDERVVRFYDTKGPRVLDFDITIKALDQPVTFQDTKEGMFGLRIASSMDVNKKAGGKITNAEGIHDDDAWGKASPWVDYTGPVNGKTVGVAILNHPESFRYPTTWHVRTYGLFAANPFGWRDFGQKSPGDHVIAAGGSITFRYRVILHEGNTREAKIAQAFQGYAKPPSVEVVAE